MSLQDRIESLKVRHAALESAIAEETRRPFPNEVQIGDLKRQKLKIKDEINRIDGVASH
jgi:hypothetical protein